MNQPNPPNTNASTQMANTPAGYPYAGQPQPYADDEIDLKELWNALWRQKRLISLIAGAVTFVALLYALMATPIYQSSSTLAPVKSGSGGGGLSALAGQFGGLASLAGINLPSSASSTDEALARMKSRRFLEGVIVKHQLKPLLFPELWDAEQSEWLPPKMGWVASVKDVFGLYTPPELNTNPLAREILVAGEPSLDAAYGKLSKMINLSTDKQSGLITFALEGEDPTLLTLWNALLVLEINQVIRQEMLADARASNEFLEAQLQKTALAELRQAIYSIMESNVKTLLLGETTAESVFKTIDPAVYPSEPIKPKRSLIVAVGMVLGVMLGIFVALIRNAMHVKEEENPADVR
jgi:hypothetical protein